MKNQTPLFQQGGQLKQNKKNNMPIDPKQQPPYYTPGTSSISNLPKVYKSIIHQTSTNSQLTVNELQNSIGTITLNRQSEGTYEINSPALFTTDKTMIFPLGPGGQLAIPVSQPAPTMFNYIMSYQIISASQIMLYFQQAANPFTFIDIYDINAVLKINIHIEVFQ